MGSSPARWRELDALLGGALELPPSDRPAWIAARCGSDASLRAELWQLLSWSEASDPRFDGPGSLARCFGGSAAPAHAIPPVPERVGVWRLVRELGRGGMAVVYEAEREDGGFRQSAAVKLLATGAWDADAVRRFEQERQILALLAHPAIASLLDGGIAPDGRPFLVVELVRGLPITLHAQRQRLDPAARLALVVQVARAVGVAHRRLVIHRDLKPSNVLVDENGVPKLLDFGIARVLASDFPGELPRTRTAQRLLTPEYASPEQVLGRPVTVASDIYQLGLLLYEVVTDRRAQPLPDGDITAIVRVVCEQDPVRPSQVATGRAWPRTRDLDAIVLRALRKEPESRYPSADALADDIEAYLDERPVAALRGSRAYRAARFATRHRVGLAASILLLAALVGYTVTVSIQSARVRRERDRASLEAQRADELKNFVFASFIGADPGVAMGRGVVLRDHLASVETRARIGLAGRPALSAEILATIGQVYITLSEYDRAIALLRDAVADSRRASPADALALAEALRHLGRAFHYSGRYRDAEGAFRESLQLVERQLAADDPRLTVLRRHIGCVAHATGRYDEAAPLLRRALAETEDQARRHLADPTWARLDLADLLFDSGSLPESAALYRAAADAAQRLDPPDEVASLWAQDGLGRIDLLEGRLEEAAALLEPTLARRQQLFAPQHPLVAESLRSVGLVRLAQGRLDEAGALLHQAAEIYRTVLTERHAWTARAELDLARLEAARARPAVSAERARRAASLLERAGLADHPWHAEALFAARWPAREGAGSIGMPRLPKER